MTDTRPVLEQVILVVKDMDATLKFYGLLGLEIADTHPDWQAHHRSTRMPNGIDLDFDSEEFAQKWDTGWHSKGSGGAVLGFRVSSREAVDQLYKDVTNAGYAGQQEPYDAFWGARYAIVEDPDGNAVALKSPSDPALRTTPTPP